LCEPAKSLREAGKNLGDGFTAALGRVTVPHAKVRTEAECSACHFVEVQVPQVKTNADGSEERSPTKNGD
jgi:hypothetical protein